MGGCRGRLLALLPLAAFLALACGCGGSRSDEAGARIAPGGRNAPTHAKLAVGSKVRDCDIVFDGPGPADWRRHSRWIGPFGLAGPRSVFAAGFLLRDRRPVTLLVRVGEGPVRGL